MSEIPAFSYDLLWNERVIRSVANLTRRDGEDFLALAPKIPVRTEVRGFPVGTSQRGPGSAAQRCDSRSRGLAAITRFGGRHSVRKQKAIFNSYW